MTPKRNNFIILVLGALTAITPFSIDMYLPAFQTIAKDFNTTTARVGFSLSAYFIGVSIGQLLYGPLLDRFGRKPPLYVGLCIYILASVGCTMTTTIDGLVIFRLVQALGGCVASVASFAMVRDLFPQKDSAKIFSSLVLVLSVSPLIAPTVGSYMSIAFGWESVFFILAGITLTILLIVAFALPESKGPDPHYSLRPSFILGSYLEVVKEPRFYTYAFSGGIAFAGLFVFISSSPFVYMELFGLNERQYGMMFPLLVSGVIGGTQVNHLLLKKYSSEKIILVSSICQVFFGLVLLMITWANQGNVYNTTFLLFLFLSCVGVNFPNSSALSLAPFGHNAGTASALLGALQLVFGALASFIVSISTVDTAIPMALMMAVVVVVANAVLLTGRHFISKRAEEAALRH